MVGAGRAAEIDAFLACAGWRNASRLALTGDASARQYERLRRGTDRAILMDSAGAPEQVAPFLAVRDILASAGLSVPRVLAEDTPAALLLVEDFGDDSLTLMLDRGGDAQALYELSVDALVHLHRTLDGSEPSLRSLPCFDTGRWVEIVGLFADHYVPRHGRTPDPQARHAFDVIWRELLQPLDDLPVSLLLRDYHAGNLHWLPGRTGVRACGLIDFQDAGVGSCLYDLISLLEDARRDLASDIAAACRARYLDAFPSLDRDVFDTAWHALALQRHLRVIAVFDRLAAGGNNRYIVHMPRLWRYVGGHLAVLGDNALSDWLRRHLHAAPWT